MTTTYRENEQIVRLLMHGFIGEANSRWNVQLGVLSNQLRCLSKQSQLDLLAPLRQILSCQQQEDWVGMADALRYKLNPALTRVLP
jgi:hypothetical protein